MRSERTDRKECPVVVPEPSRQAASDHTEARASYDAAADQAARSARTASAWRVPWKKRRANLALTPPMSTGGPIGNCASLIRAVR
jgi:hypothetical protein